jgi:WD40 repeat protein
MATPRYTLHTTLSTGHSNSITALQFSPDGYFFASGSADGVVMIFSISTWKPMKRYVDASPLTVLIWHPTFPKTLICGYRSGDVHTINFQSHSIASYRFSNFSAPYRANSFVDR